MKGYSDILTIVRDKLGLVNMAAYKAYCDSFADDSKPRVPTPEEIALLSPDVVDNKAFWEVAERLFSTDAVSNCQFTEPVSKREAAKRNLWLYRSDGFLGWLEELERPDKKLLEIGPGYGALRQWIDVNTRYDYYGVDVYPKIEEIDEAERNGLMGAVTKARRYDIVVAENVFQHLSVNQRRAYYRDVFEILAPGGFFMVSSMRDHHADDSPYRDKDGRLWMRHYGQFTEIQRVKDIKADLDLLFSVESETYRPGWVALICRKKS